MYHSSNLSGKLKMIFVCLLFLSSCVSNNNRVQQEEDFIYEPPYTISLEREIEKLHLTNLSEIGNTITYIPLETSGQSLLRDLGRIKVANEHIAVYDKFNVLLFDTSGRFITQIGRLGQGPGEYSMYVSDFVFSLNEKTIYLMVEEGKCLEYNVDGKFLNSYKIDTPPQAVLPLNDSMFVFFSRNTAKRIGRPIDPSIIIADLNNNIQKIYPNHYKMNNEQNVAFSISPFYSHRGQIRFKEFGIDTLYTITENELIPYSFLTLGKYLFQGNISADVYSANSNEEIERKLKELYAGKYYMETIWEDYDNLYLTMSCLDNTSLYGYFNKRANSAKVIGDQGFKNNIDGGLPFFPKYVYNDNILVDYVNAFTLREHVLNGNATEMRRLYGQKYDDLVKLVNSIDDESNPIVVMVKR